mgnify:FL=1
MLWPENNTQWSEEWLQRYVTTQALKLGLLFHGDALGANKGAGGGSKMKLTGACKGWPDMVFILHGRIVFIELKKMDGKLSSEQRNVHKRMVDMGHSVEVVYGFDGKDAWNKVRGILGV